MTPGTRTTLLKLHRWVGLAFAALLLVQGLTGTLLVFRAEIEGIIHPALVVTPGEALPVQTLVDTVREASPQATLQRIRFSEDPTRAAIFVMRANDAPWMVAVDPYSGRIVRAGSYAAWPTEWLFHLHDTLLAGKTGEIIVTVEGVALIFLAVFGIIIWWPGRRRLKSGFRILTGQGADRTVRTAHRAIGAAIGIVLVMSGVTGALLIHRAALQPYLPVVPRPKFEVALSQVPLRPVDTLIADARARHGPLPLREVRFSGDAGQVVALYFQDETSRRPNATRQYFYNAYEGVELGRYEPAALPPMNTAYDWLFTIHTGKAGGLVGRLVVLAAGLSLVFFAGSGVWLWLSARRQKRARRAKAESRLVRNAA
ncbi:PepSY-associated TM helix domain-containing protein [Sphingosinicella xenopeptidilytica]|uniref:PepSY-associated TM helix domain-containing protein n=1 Tax=Sphingosinicella xenopeptidilytica TaxID=364098 RepID=A0ABW3C3N7_SPHXN